MKTIQYPNRFLLAALAVAAIGMISTASADEGVARIADGQYSGEPQLLSFEGSSVEYGGYVDGGCPNCNYGEACDSCEGSCPKDGCCNKYPPDAGWGRPIRNYIQRVPVSYLKRWPDSVSGINHPGPMKTFPMVYQPTDTTQLGFYYQRVPTWHAKPWMLPPMPWPNQWHQREYGYKTPTYGSACENGACQGEVIYGEVIYEGGSSTSPVTSPKQQPTAVPPLPEVRHSSPDRLRPVAY